MSQTDRAPLIDAFRVSALPKRVDIAAFVSTLQGCWGNQTGSLFSRERPCSSFRRQQDLNNIFHMPVVRIRVSDDSGSPSYAIRPSNIATCSSVKVYQRSFVLEIEDDDQVFPSLDELSRLSAQDGPFE